MGAAPNLVIAGGYPIDASGRSNLTLSAGIFSDRRRDQARGRTSSTRLASAWPTSAKP